MTTSPKLRIGTVVRHTFSGDEATVLTEPRRVMVGDIYEWWVDIKHRGRREKNVNVEYLELDDAKERAVAAGKKRESHDRWNRREAGEDDTECLDAWDKADMAALGFIEEGA